MAELSGNNPRFAILNPCSQRWSDLTGGERKRFCRRCQTFVHVADRYSPSEFAQLRRESTAPFCGYLASKPFIQPLNRRGVLIGAMLTAVSSLMAQTGRVRIRVTDQMGAVVSSASASIADKTGRATVAGRANEAGEIILTDLPVGQVKISVACAGFDTLPLTVTIWNADEVKIDAVLKVGTMGTLVLLYQPGATLEPVRSVTNQELTDHQSAAPRADRPEPAPAHRKRKHWWRIFHKST